MTKKELKLAKLNGTLDMMYGEEVNALIRKKYSLSQELAIMRQKDEKPEEWDAYNAYCEECKATAKAAVYSENV